MWFKSIDCSGQDLFAFNVPLTELASHYLARVQFLKPQASFQMKSCDTVVCCDSWSDFIYPSPSADLWLYTAHLAGAVEYTYCISVER